MRGLHGASAGLLRPPRRALHHPPGGAERGARCPPRSDGGPIQHRQYRPASGGTARAPRQHATPRRRARQAAGGWRASARRHDGLCHRPARAADHAVRRAHRDPEDCRGERDVET
eukprot:6522480-Pyramimonas_sp.AAC.2